MKFTMKMKRRVFILLLVPNVNVVGLTTNAEAVDRNGPISGRRCFLSTALLTPIIGTSPTLASADSISNWVRPSRKSAHIESVDSWQQTQPYTTLGKNILLADELNPLSPSLELLPSENELYYGTVRYLRVFPFYKTFDY